MNNKGIRKLILHFLSFLSFLSLAVAVEWNSVSYQLVRLAGLYLSFNCAKAPSSCRIFLSLLQHSTSLLVVIILDASTVTTMSTKSPCTVIFFRNDNFEEGKRHNTRRRRKPNHHTAPFLADPRTTIVSTLVEYAYKRCLLKANLRQIG